MLVFLGTVCTVHTYNSHTTCFSFTVCSSFTDSLFVVHRRGEQCSCYSNSRGSSGRSGHSDRHWSSYWNILPLFLLSSQVQDTQSHKCPFAHECQYNTMHIIARAHTHTHTHTHAHTHTHTHTHTDVSFRVSNKPGAEKTLKPMVAPFRTSTPHSPCVPIPTTPPPPT